MVYPFKGSFIVTNGFINLINDLPVLYRSVKPLKRTSLGFLGSEISVGMCFFFMFCTNAVINGNVINKGL